MTMQARDASGRQVSLLNDDPVSQTHYHRHHHHRHHEYQHQHHQPHRLSSSHRIYRSNSNSPITPELLRSDSYDSNASCDPVSPLTPSVGGGFDYSRAQLFAAGSGYDDYDHSTGYGHVPKRPSQDGSSGSSRSTSYEDESPGSGGAGSERPGKRYPCRYRDSHGCEKTFTTSGHASRHSKIHTAEKAVQCTFVGCHKKFTRADNMKQHLETHYKDKSRSSGSSRSAARSSTSISSGSSSKRSLAALPGGSNPGETNGSSSARPRDVAAWDAEQQYVQQLPSSGAGAWDMRGLNLPLLNRPQVARNPSSGLDALAMAIACQEGA